MKNIQDQLKKSIFEAVKEAYPTVQIKPEDIFLEHPTVEEHGDYSSNIAMKLKIDPAKVIKNLKGGLPAVALAKAGFINFKLGNEFFLEKVKEINEQGEKYGCRPKNGKKIVIEIVSPNINKPLHIGHLRNGALGMSIANAYETAGWEVVRDEINNDRGLHIMKAAYGYLLFGQIKPVENKEWKELLNLWMKKQAVF